MNEFAPINGILGGLLLGIGASTLLLFNGNALGCSGIINSTIENPRKSFCSKDRWNSIFMLSFIATSAAITLIFPEVVAVDVEDLRARQGDFPFLSNIGYAISGFLTGFGTELGSGCTSGHGICGLARLSVRSLMAVMLFMGTGIVTTTFLLPRTANTFLQISAKDAEESVRTLPKPYSIVLSTFAILASFHFLFNTKTKAVVMKKEGSSSIAQKKEANDLKKLPFAAAAASIFAAGLAVSGMVRQQKIYGFLDMRGIFEGYYDATLILVMGGGLVVSAAGYHWVEGFNYFKNDKTISCPISQNAPGGKFDLPQKKDIDAPLVLGAAIFGVGWGLGGLCPGPALFVASSGFTQPLFYWWPSNFLGVLTAIQVRKLFN